MNENIEALLFGLLLAVVGFVGLRWMRLRGRAELMYPLILIGGIALIGYAIIQMLSQ